MHNLIFLTDLTGSDLDPYMRLNEAQLFHALEPNPGLFIAESPKVIERALRAGYRPASLLIEEKELERDLADLDYEMAINQTRGLEQTPIYVVNSKLLRQLAGGGYNLLRGALAAMHRVERPSLNNFLATMPSGHPRIAILESVVNPTNIGAIFRSAEVDRLAIILGSEGPGLRENTIAQSDFTIKIPMAAGVDSLNVAAASALAFWELGNQKVK